MLKLGKIALVGIAAGAALLIGVGAGVGVGFAAFADAASGVFTQSTSEATSILFDLHTRKKPTSDTSLTKLESVVAGTAAAPAPVKLVTDGGEINDKSFNEQAFNSLLDIYYGSAATNRPTELRGLVNQPNGTNASDIASAYATAITGLGASTTTVGAGAAGTKKVILAPGFYHAEAIKTFQKDTTNPTDVNFVLVDSGATYGDFSGDAPVFTPLKNTYGITFDTKSAGFQAGYLSGLYLEVIGDRTPTVGTFGGGDFSAVTDFMVGFTTGVKYYNENNGVKADVKFAKFASDADYTNTGFGAGGGRSRADSLVASGADVILPVAGPQTADTIAAIKASSRKDEVKVIGVDSDQSQAYKEDESLFLTSIIKNLRKAMYEGYKSFATGTDSTLLGTAVENKKEEDAGSKTFKVGLTNNFTTYIKQFEKAGVWKDMYAKVDALSETVINAKTVNSKTLSKAAWADALAYIKAN